MHVHVHSSDVFEHLWWQNVRRMVQYGGRFIVPARTCDCSSELLDGLKAHKKKVSKLMARQKHLKFEDTDIGKIK